MALYIGLISGTSMDAVDAALVAFSDGGACTVATHAASIPDDLKRELHALTQHPSCAAIRFWNADAQLGSVFAGAALELLEVAGVDARDVTAIGSHGQTVYHAPGAATPLTVQLGDPSIIAERTGIATVADFRRRDIAAGGEGAPLAPAFHRACSPLPGSSGAFSTWEASRTSRCCRRTPTGLCSASIPDPGIPSSMRGCAADSVPRWTVMRSLRAGER